MKIPGGPLSFSILVSVNHKPMDDDNLKNKLLTKPDAIDWVLKKLHERLSSKIPEGSSCQVAIGDLAKEESNGT